MKKVRTEKVNKAIQKSKIENIRKAALEKVKARNAAYPCTGAGCSGKARTEGGFCDFCANEPAEDHK